ncbi:MAG: hypothetical protein R3C11_21095 [Planctomycetaceae bacterium]
MSRLRATQWLERCDHWAGHDPKSAREVSPVLARIVSGKCQYRAPAPETEQLEKPAETIIKRGQSPETASNQPLSVTKSNSSSDDMDNSEESLSMSAIASAFSTEDETLRFKFANAVNSGETWCYLLASQPGEPIINPGTHWSSAGNR